MTKRHWTHQIKRDREAFELALIKALTALEGLGEDRLEKERRCPWGGDGSIAYRTCAEEISRIGKSFADAIKSELAEKGIYL